MNDTLIQVLSSGGYININKTLIKKYGIDVAVMLGQLCADYSYNKIKDTLTEDGYFLSTISHIEEETSLSEYRQYMCLALLEASEVVDVKVLKMPAKRYIKIDEKYLKEFIDLDTETAKNFRKQVFQNFGKQGSKKIGKQGFQNFGKLNTNTNNTNTNIQTNIPSTLSKDSVKGIAHPEGGDATRTPQTQSKNNQIYYPSGETKKESNGGCFRGKRSLISNPPTPLSEEDLVGKVTNTKTRTQQTEEDGKSKNTQFKRPRYLGSVKNIVSMELNLQDQDKLQEIVDWFDSIYDKGVTTTKGVRFRKCMLQLMAFYKKYSWSELQGVLDTCTQNAYCKLDYGLNKSSRNTIQKSAKYFDMKEGETVEEWNKRYFSERRRVKDAVKTDIRSIYNTEDIK